MKAVGINFHGDGFADLQLDSPVAGGRDLLVAVEAVSVNPLDTKVHASARLAPQPPDAPKILGWDAAGKVVATGPDVEHFSVGQKVFYAGEITRSGSNSQFHLVDERIAGQMPETLDYAQAAALPLTSLTAWEALFDRLGISKTGQDEGGTLLVIGGAGGVGSIAIQLASKLARLKVIATASRPESADWVRKAGASLVIDHHGDMPEQLKAAGYKTADFILCLNNTEQHWAAMARMASVAGRICSIVETSKPIDLDLLKRKCVSFVWESMFTRSIYKTPDMIEQHHILNQVSRLIDQGLLTTTLTQTVTPINAQNLAQVHASIGQGHSLGKWVLSGWQ